MTGTPIPVTQLAPKTGTLIPAAPRKVQSILINSVLGPKALRPPNTNPLLVALVADSDDSYVQFLLDPARR
jgi:hypothetical protein